MTLRLWPALQALLVIGRREAPPAAHWVVSGANRVTYLGQRVYAHV
jgi:hypothetical protein